MYKEKPKMILRRNFYQKETLEVAKDLLGCELVRKVNGKIKKGIITETEAYIGENDLACHASRGKTKRTEIMYGKAGHAYIYLIYGMYNCFNLVTEKKGFPAAVLIRSVLVEGVEFNKTNGPGKLCRYFEIDRELNGHDLTLRKFLWIEKRKNFSSARITPGKRVGVEYAKHCKDYKWNFKMDIDSFLKK